MLRWMVSTLILMTSIHVHAKKGRTDAASLPSALSMIRWTCGDTSSSWWLEDDLDLTSVNGKNRSGVKECETLKAHFFDSFLARGIFIFEPRFTHFHKTSSKDALKTQIKKALELYPFEFYLIGRVVSEMNSITLEFDLMSSATQRRVTSLSRTFQIRKTEKTFAEDDLSSMTNDFINPTRKLIHENRHKHSRFSLEIMSHSSKLSSDARTCLGKTLKEGELLELRTLQKKSQIYEFSSARSIQESQNWLKKSSCLSQLNWTLKSSD